MWSPAKRLCKSYTVQVGYYWHLMLILLILKHYFIKNINLILLVFWGSMGTGITSRWFYMDNRELVGWVTRYGVGVNWYPKLSPESFPVTQNPPSPADWKIFGDISGYQPHSDAHWGENIWISIDCIGSGWIRWTAWIRCPVCWTKPV